MKILNLVNLGVFVWLNLLLPTSNREWRDNNLKTDNFGIKTI